MFFITVIIGVAAFDYTAVTIGSIKRICFTNTSLLHHAGSTIHTFYLNITKYNVLFKFTF